MIVYLPPAAVNNLSVSLFTSVCPLLCLFPPVYLPINLSVSLSTCLCLCLPACLSLHLFVSELERLSGLVGRPSESHPLHNSGLLSLDPVQDKTPLYSQLLQAYKWSNKVTQLTC